MQKCKCGHYKANHYQTYSEYDENGKWKGYIEKLEGCRVCHCQKFVKSKEDLE